MTPERPGPIFLTARFRSGSTMLWHLYDQAPGYRAYYEPCHDNLLAHIRHTAPMESHHGVRTYWDAYLPLLPELERLHRPEFGLTRLYLEEGDRWPELEAYLRHLVEAASPDTPVLGFNRADLRLAWLRDRFPEARIVHLYRDPRDVWASMVGHFPADRLQAGAADEPYEPHVYDLVEWSASLAGDFPFLADPEIEFSYERHYGLWKLSLLLGTRRSDVSLSYDDDFRADPGRALRRLREAGCLSRKKGEDASTEWSFQAGATSAWEKHHPKVWFEEIEHRCEAKLDALGLTDLLGRAPLAEIRRAHARAWADYDRVDLAPMMRAILLGSSRHRGEVTRLLQLARSREEDPQGREEDS